MSEDAVSLWLTDSAERRRRAAEAERERLASLRAKTSEERARVAEDGGLIAYAERLARKRWPSKASSMRHLAPLAEQCDQAERAILGQCPPVFCVMHAPVQHGKTSLLQASVARTLRRNPRAVIGYVAFNADRATGKMWEVRELAAGEGIRLHPTFSTKREWRTVEGGIVRAGGILDGSWTGGGFDLLICDDLYAGPKEAESRAHRDKVEAAFDTVLETRGQGRTSILVNMARWNPADISGTLIKRGWPYVCLPAIRRDEDGVERALWPEVVSLEYLLGKRDGIAATADRPAKAAIPRRYWSSLYQGQPIPEGAHVFDPNALRYYGGPANPPLPSGPYREAMGIDVAYSSATRNDQSVYVILREYVAAPGELYLVEAWIGHEPVEAFGPRVAKAQRRGSYVIPALWYASGTEIGGAGALRMAGAVVHTVPAGIDKLARARGGYVDPEIGGTTSAWNDGHVWWPATESEHAKAIRLQAGDFTGAPTDDDDGIDSLVAAHDALQIDALQMAQTAPLQVRRPVPRGLDGGVARMRGW